MAYKTADLKKKAIEIVSKNQTVFFIEDVVSLLPCAKPTFYDHFPNDSNDYKEIFSYLEDNRVTMKLKIRDKLHKGEKAAELLALYRLICSPEERQNLNQSYIDHSTKGKEINNNFEVTIVSPEED